MRKLIILISLALSMKCVYAQDVASTRELTTDAQNTTPNNTIIGSAQNWALTADEWSQYLKLMQGPNGHWYPQLTPPAVLGLNAETPQEQKHFAEIVLRRNTINWREN